MTFVYPLLLGGLLLAGVPVVLHFLVRRKPKVLLFPAFRFLVLKQRSNTRSLRLRHLLLLLLRVLLIVLVCLAFARPRLFHDAIGLSHEKPAAIVLVLDTSPSMGYKSGDMTRLDLAKQRCLELLDQLPEDGRVLILDTADPAGWAREEWLKSLDKSRTRIQGMTIRSTSSPVNKAIDEGLRRFDEWDRLGGDPEGAGLPRIVCVFSDRTKASWDPAAPARKPETPVQMLYFDVGIDDAIDLAITHVELPGGRQSFAEGDKIPLRAVVAATGKGLSDANTLLVFVNGKEVAAQTFNLDPGKPQTLTVDIDTSKLGVGPHHAEVKLATAADALPFNNVRFLTFNVHKKQNVLVLADDLAKTGKFAKVLSALLYAVDHKTPADKVDLNSYDAVFLVSVAGPTDAIWKSLADYVKKGGGVGIIPPGDELQAERYNCDAAKDVMPGRIVRKIETVGAEWNLADSEIQHSFLSLYTKWFAEGWDFSVHPGKAMQYWELDTKDAVVRYDDGRPAVAVRKTNGKVLLLTTPVDKRGSTWNNYGKDITSFYFVLTLMCATHLCPEPADAALNFQFGARPPDVQKAPTWAYQKFMVSSGDVSEEIRFDEPNRWIGDRLPREGNYTVIGVNADKQENVPIHRFSINVPGDESDLTRVPVSDIEAVMGKDSLVPQDRRTALRDTLTWDEPVELFPWLMIGLLFLLALENLLANKFYHQEPAEA